MATTWSVTDSSRIRFNIDLDWTGTNTLSWSIKVVDGEYAYNYGNCLYFGYLLNGVEQTIYSWDDHNISNYKRIANGVTVATGSTTISGTADPITLFFRFKQYQSGGSWIIPTTTTSLSRPYTNCTAPTTINISSSTININNVVAKDTLNVNIEWSGALAGNNNPITSYEIYYKVASSPTEPTISDNHISSNTTSCTFNSEQISFTEGLYLTIKVKSIGTQSSYSSNLSTVSLTVKMNNLPSAPSIISSSGIASGTNKRIIKSGNGSATIVATPGTDTDGQTYQVWYATTEEGTKSLLQTTSMTPGSEPGSTVTWYFWTYDGLDYSLSPTIFTIERNILTSFSITSTTTTTYIANNSSYVKSFSSNYTRSGQKRNLTINLYVKYNSNNYIKANTYSITSDSGNINIAIGSIIVFLYGKQIFNNAQDTTFYYKFGYTDGIEDESFLSESTYNVPGISSLRQSTVLYDGTYQANSKMYLSRRFVFYKDEFCNKYKCTATGSTSGTIQLSTTQTINGNEIQLDLILLTQPVSEESITFTIKAYNNYYEKQLNTDINGNAFTYTEVKQIPTMSVQTTGLGSSCNVLKNAVSSTDIVTNWPFSDYIAWSDISTAYDLDQSATNAVKLRFINGNYYITRSFTSVVKTGDQLSSNFNCQTIFGADLKTGLRLSKIAGTPSINYCYEITNKFGQTFLSTFGTTIFNLNENPISVTIGNLKYANSASSSSWTSIGNKFLQKGAYLKCSCVFNLYTEENITLQIYGKITSGLESSYSLLHEENLTSDLNYASAYNTSGTNTRDIVFGPFDSSYNYDHLSLKIIGNSGYESSYADLQVSVLQQLIEVFQLTSCNYHKIDENNSEWLCASSQTLNPNTTDTSAGINVNYQLVATVNDIEVSLTSAISAFPTSTSSPIPNTYTSNWNTLNAKIKYQLELTASSDSSNIVMFSTSTESYYSNEYLVYNQSPTVALRENAIGINTSSVATTDILSIAPATGRDKVSFYPISSSAAAAYIDFDELTISLFNFVIDGGEI